MKTLEELKALFEEKGIADVHGDVSALVEAEKTRGIEAKRAANREAEGLRKRAKAFEAVAKNAGIETFDDIEGLIIDLSEKLKGAEAGGKAKEKLSETERKLDAIMKKLEQSDKEKEQYARKSKEATIRQALTQAMGDKVIGLPIAIESLLAKGAVDLDGDSVVFKNGDDVLSLQDGVNRFVADYPELAKSKQAAGGGSAGGGSKNTKTMARAEFDALGPLEKVAAVKSGTAITE